MRVLSIDVGTRNMGWALWDQRIVDFGVIDLQDVSYFARAPVSEKEIRKICKGKDYPKQIWLLKQTGFFDGVDKILVERQMQCKMIVIGVAIRCFSFVNTVMISPSCVRRHFKTLMHKHRLNKKAHVKYAQQYIAPSLVKKFTQHKKKDDISDAIMQAMFYISTSGSSSVSSSDADSCPISSPASQSLPADNSSSESVVNT